MMNSEKYYQMANEQLKEQFKTIDVLNAKINTLLIVCGVFADCLERLKKNKSMIFANFAREKKISPYDKETGP